MIRGLPLENLWMQKRRKTLAEDVVFMNKMVDEIVAERRRGNADAGDGKKDMLAAMMTASTAPPASSSTTSTSAIRSTPS
jgi:cytochrome P450/NADPH-cytochrome P450 reductase